jgi:hypothetical protein
MRRKYGFLILMTLVSTILAAIWVPVWRERPSVKNALHITRPPQISPDYSGLVIPPNIAPLNFSIREEGQRFFVRIRSRSGEPIEITRHSRKVTIPIDRWRSLLDANRGQELLLDVFAKADGEWRRYQTITNTIADQDIDPCLVYRLIRPLYSNYRQTAVQQRDLTTYDESVVLDGASLGYGCVNCHSFAGNDPNRMCIGIRSSKFGEAAVVAVDGRVKKVDTKFGYTAWHPSGRLAVYSINPIHQFFHSTGAAVRDIVDMNSALAYYLAATEEVKLVPRAADKNRLESYPAWSPDGRYLYYCSAPLLWRDYRTMPPDRYAEVKYDLMRIRYDVNTDSWGWPEIVLSSSETGMSILIPRISPDGRYLLFCMCRYGCFPAFQPSSDLYMMDLTTGDYRFLDINSRFSDSWHSWSSNGRWIAFSSKRRASPFTRCYLSFVDQTGKAHKAFLLPQRDPEFYDSFLKTVSVPELLTGPVPVSAEALTRAARSKNTVAVDAVTGPTPIAGSEPWLQVDR